MTAGTVEIVFLTGFTVLVAALNLYRPWRDREWGNLATAGLLHAVGYVLALLLVQSRELHSPIRWIERLTQAIIGLFR